MELVARMQVNGPFKPLYYLSSAGALNLIELSVAATAAGRTVTFMGEWGKGLLYGCVVGMTHHQQMAAPKVNPSIS